MHMLSLQKLHLDLISLPCVDLLPLFESVKKTQGELRHLTVGLMRAEVGDDAAWAKTLAAGLLASLKIWSPRRRQK